jgi:anti-sigma factor RsiW
MSCEKYSGWMNDTALGDLRAEREPELLAHAMECAACREAPAHARAVHEFVDRRVESLVAGEPSPQFATHLRRRIGLEAEQIRSPWTAWAPVTACALALAVILAIMVARSPVHNGSNPNVAFAVNPISAPPEAVSASAESPRNVKGMEGKRGGHTRAATTTLEEIIVPKGQLSAAAQLISAINSGRVDGNQFLAAQQEYEKRLEVKPIEIAPREIPALDDVTDKPTGSLQF